MHTGKSTILIFISTLLLYTAISSIPALADKAAGQDEALKLLKKGNARFVEMKLQHPNSTIERRQKTAAAGQRPFATVLTCSDSRVPAEIIFDRGIGDIFVVRVAGNIAVDSSVIGSIEYAAKYLNSPLLLIMGHTECGAVEAAIKGYAVEGGIRDIQKQIEPIAIKTKKEHPEFDDSDMLSYVTKSNVLQAKEDILSQSPMIATMVKNNEIKIVASVYDVETGKVDWIE